ncbi:IclR family transcriptional regulator [Inhella sp.]|uniref:IclR family transcriptional regulator n=1 Tax=Inhella sp. TaxID=1921806 RepID=UPI0035B1E503
MSDKAPRGVQSIEVGGGLLLALARAGRPLALKDLAAAAGMGAAKAHPYLVSFARLGLVSAESGRYGLGPLAMELGLISLQQHDPVRIAAAELEPLAQASGCTAALAVWGNQGPTVVRVAEAPSPVHVSLRHGTVLNLAQTATGRAMAAFRPADEVERLWRAQGGGSLRAWREALREAAALGFAHSDEALLPGVAALAVPACDTQGLAQCALLVVAPRQQLMAAGRQQEVLALLQAAVRRVCAQLGWAIRPPREAAR